MTIQRKYSLPNCTLILEGLSSPTTGNGQADARPLLSMLINAECHFTTTNTTLAGGRDFFESLVMAVSAYAQEFLSKVPRPQANKPVGLVQLQKIDGNWHRLIVAGTEDRVSKSGELARPTQVDLTTVQLFDLVEAVDQFFADSQTLPDLPPQLKLAAKRRSSRMGEQAVPAAVGVSSLALAAIAAFFVPIPPVQRPAQPKPQQNSTSTPTNSASNQSAASPTLAASPTPSTTTTPVASPSTADLEATLNTSSEITDSSQLYTLTRKLRDQIDQNWKTRSKVNQDLVYRVSVASDGSVIGYKPVNEAAGNLVDRTPLPGLVYTPAAKNSAPTHDPIAQFKVVFTAKGVPQVSPWQGYKQPSKVLGGITNPKQLGDLKQKVYEQVRQNWSGTPKYRRDLIYRVATTKDGVIADYEPNDQSAYDYVNETPLPKLAHLNSSSGKGAVKTQDSLTQFKVVFKHNGVLEVGPW